MVENAGVEDNFLRKAVDSLYPPAKSDVEKKNLMPLIAAILSVGIPGSGQYLIGSPRAKAYFMIYAALWLIMGFFMFAPLILSFFNPLFFLLSFLVFPFIFLLIAIEVVAGIDAFFEASTQDEKRILKFLIK